MSEQTYSEEEKKKMKIFEQAMRLRDLEVGKPLTEHQMGAIDFFIGDLINIAKSAKMEKVEINFTDKGEAYTKGGNPLGVQVNGKTPLNIEGESNEMEAD